MAQSAPHKWMLGFFRGEAVVWSGAPGFLQSLIGCARTERAQVLLFDRLLARREQIGLPAKDAADVAIRYRQGFALEMLRQEEVRRVVEALAETGLPFLLFKGTPLAYTLYPEACLRDRCDTDLLFADKTAADQAWPVLQGLGYKRMNKVEGELVSTQFPCSIHTGTHDAMLDVHWATSNSSRLRRLSFGELWDAAIPVPGLGAGARAPCHAHALVLACLHRLAHMVDGTHNKLIWLYDMNLLQELMDDDQWRQFMAWIQRKGLGGVCLDGLAQAAGHFGAGRRPERLEQVRRLAARPGQLLEPQTSVLARDLAQLRDQPGIRRRLQLLGEYLFPAADYMTLKYQPRWRCLLPYYYLKRMAQGLGRRLRLHLAGGR